MNAQQIATLGVLAALAAALQSAAAFWPGPGHVLAAAAVLTLALASRLLRLQPAGGWSREIS